MTDTTPAASPATRRALVHNAITNALTDAGDWVPLSVRIAATRAALAEVDAWYAADTASSQRAALRDRITTAISKWHRDPEQPLYEQGADAVLAVLYREWPWLHAPADRTAVLREAAQRLYTALFPAVYADLGQKAAEGVNRAVSELRRMADETATTQTDTLPAWLYQRFMPDGTGWDNLDEEDRQYWEHQARAVRQAVARGGFKQTAAGARQDGSQP